MDSMLDFNKILEEEFVHDTTALNNARVLLEKYAFHKNLRALEEQINSLLPQKGKTQDFSKLASNFLTAINTKLSIIPIIDKLQLEKIISRLGQRALYKVLALHPEPDIFLKEVTAGLDESSEINKWNKEKLFGSINLIVIKETTRSVSKKDAIKKLGFELILKTKIDAQSIIADFLFDRDVICSKKELKKIFSPSQIPCAIRIHLNKLELLMVILKELCKNKVIKCKGNRGYFNILNYHFVDHENNILFKNAPKYTMLDLVNNGPKHAKFIDISKDLLKELNMTLD